MASPDPVRARAAEITQRNVQTVRDLEAIAMADPTFADRVAAVVGRFCGSIYFVLAHALAFGAWIAINSIRGLPHWDPYPFTFLTMWASMESIFIAAFILISQNYSMRASERRDQLELQVNLLAEQEATKTLQLLEEIARAVGVSRAHDPEVAALAEATRLDALARQIDQQEPPASGQAPAPGTRAK